VNSTMMYYKYHNAPQVQQQQLKIKLNEKEKGFLIKMCLSFSLSFFSIFSY
jgi:hypothetical protein